jgi:hypothetical protein
MELLSILFGLICLFFFISFIACPFILISLTTRVHDLEAELKRMQVRERRRGSIDHNADPEPSEGETPNDEAAESEFPDWQNSGKRFSEALKKAIERPSTPANEAETIQGTSQTPPVSQSPEIEIVSKPVATPYDIAAATPERYTPEEHSLESEPASSDEPAAGETYSIREFNPDTSPKEINSKEELEVISFSPPVIPADPAKPKQSRPSKDRDEPSTLEELLAGKWLSWVGSLAVIIGAGFGFKYAVENNWIGPRERVLIGILAGISCFTAGAYAIRRNYLFLAQSLTGAGLGVLYLSFYAAFGWYGVLSYEAAFVGMICTTVLGLTFAGYFNVQPTAVLGMLGGFLTPAMLWPDHDPFWTLFPYLLMLDLGILIVAGVRRWAGLEILAFCGTLVIWVSWHHQFYQEQQLAATAAFMTAFQVLFALLSVWHNVIRKRTALAGDFFLILATPVAYFAALYTLTYERLPQWQGEFSLGVMLFYMVLAGLAAVWHPAGRSVIAALAGVASTFLILAAPLELTGHWVTICWIAQAVLLVELGLYFRERSLTWTGLALLAKVQGILLIYFVGTLADPIHFQTAFVRIQLHLIGRPETPIDAADTWWAFINGRSLSYLADVIGFAILAWELGRRRKDSALIETLLPPYRACQIWLNVTVPLAALVMLLLETYAWGKVQSWDEATILSACTIWTSLFACGVILWSRLFLSRGLEVAGWLLMGLLAAFVGFNTLDALLVASWEGQIPEHRLHALWLINPRGISFLTVILTGGIAALIYAAFPPRETQLTTPGEHITSRQLTQLLGTSAFALGLGLCLLETRVWAAHHGWIVSTALSAYAIGTTVFLLGAAVWDAVYRVKWIDQIVRGTFYLLSVWLILNSFVTLETVRHRALELDPQLHAWWLLNPRGIGYLIAALGCTFAAILHWRLEFHAPDPKRDSGWTLSEILGVGAYLMAASAILVETSVWGAQHAWLASTTLSACSVATTLLLLGVTLWRVIFRTSWVDALVVQMFVLLNGLLIVNIFTTMESVRLEQLRIGSFAENWLFNPHGIGFLIAACGCALAARLYWRQKLERTLDWDNTWTLSHTLGIGAYLIGLAMVMFETWLWGDAQSWRLGALVGSHAMWISAYVIGLVVWSVIFRTASFDQLVGMLFLSLFLLLLFIDVSTVDSLQSVRSPIVSGFRERIEPWCWNPRFLASLAAIVAATLSGRLYRGQNRQFTIDSGESPGSSASMIEFSRLFGIAVFLAGVTMFSLEVYTQGTSRNWQTATSLAVTLVWTAYGTMALIAGIYARSGWLRVFSLALFVLTVIKVFLFDVWHLETVIRVFAFMSLGVALLLVSFLYRRFRDRIRSWMTPAA